MLSVCSPFDRSPPISCHILTDLARSHFPFLSLTISLTVPKTTHSSPNPLGSSASFLSVSHSNIIAHPFPSSTRVSRPPFAPQRQHHSPSDQHTVQPPATSFYLPATSASTSALTDINQPFSSTFSSTSSNPSSMIVSALSFYDPAQASSIPDHPNPRWDAPFDPSFTDSEHTSLIPRASVFQPATASISHESFPSLHSNTPFSRSSQFQAQSQHLAAQHRQSVLSGRPRRRRHPTELESQVQSLSTNHGHDQGRIVQEQREAESQVRHLLSYNLLLFHLYQSWHVFSIVFRLKNAMLPPRSSRTNVCKSCSHCLLIPIPHNNCDLILCTVGRTTKPPHSHRINQRTPTRRSRLQISILQQT